MIFAAQNGHTETAQLLLDMGADIHTKTKSGKTALMEAVNAPQRIKVLNNVSIPTINLLLELGADLPNNKSNIIRTMKKTSWWTKLHTTIINNELDKIQSHEYNASDINPLDLAIMVGNLDAVRAITGRGIQYDINACLRNAIFTKRNEVAKFFLENGATPAINNKRGQTAFHIAAATNNYPIIRTLVEFDKKNNAASYLQKSFRSSLFQYKKRKALSHEIGQNNKCIRIS